MRNTWLSAAMVALLCYGCVSNPARQISVETQNRISACGGGLRLTSNYGLAADINRELATGFNKGGRLTARAQRSLEAAFVSRLGGSREDAEEIFARYAGCVEGTEKLESVIAQFGSRSDKLRSQLRGAGVDEGRIDEIVNLRQLEASALSSRDFISSRRLSNQVVNLIVTSIVQAGGSPDRITFELSEDDRQGKDLGKLSDQKRSGSKDEFWEKLENLAENVCAFDQKRSDCRAAAERAGSNARIVPRCSLLAGEGVACLPLD